MARDADAVGLRLQRITGNRVGPGAAAAADVAVLAETPAPLEAAESLERARQIAGEELVATELRVALDELAKVAGAVYTDDVLDRIFSRFCIGK